MAKCKLEEKECIQCGECDYCPYEENKICDNCFKCLEVTDEYAEIIIDEIILPKSTEEG